MRRMNPRDTAANINRRRTTRRGRHSRSAFTGGCARRRHGARKAAFMICASLDRSSSSRKTSGKTTETFTSSVTNVTHHRCSGRQAARIQIPKRPIRKTINRLPVFTTVRSGATSSSRHQVRFDTSRRWMHPLLRQGDGQSTYTGTHLQSRTTSRANTRLANVA